VRRVVLALALITLAGCPEEGPPPEVPDASAPVKPQKPVVAQLSELKGEVFLTRDGQRGPAKAGNAYEGDLLETGADGHALLANGGREVELLESTRFRVGKTLGELTLSVGELSLEESDAGETKTLRTSAASRVRLEAVDGGTSFVVGVGFIEFDEGEDAGSATMKAGERYVLGVGLVELEEPTPPEPPPVEAKPSVKLTPRGSVTLKPKSGPSAKLAATGRVLEEPGTFIVEKGSQLRAEAGGLVAEIEAGAKGTIEPQKGDPPMGVTLTQGTARLFLTSGQSVLVGGKKPLTVKAKTGSTVLVTGTTTGPRVEVLGGETEISSGGGAPVKVGPNEVATPKGKGVDKGRRGTATLSLPSGKNTRVYWGRPGDVTLQFKDGEGPLEVSTEPTFSSLLVSAEGGDLVTVPAPLKGSLYWRRKGDEEASSARFEKDESASAASAKTDTVAETGLKATVIFQSVVPTLTFTFPLKDGASSWRFRVYATSDLKSPVVDRRVNENRTVVESGTLKEGTYVWSAVAMDKSGTEAPGGRMNKMDIVFDNSVTRLVLTTPREGERASTATGLAPLGSRLSLNGKSVPLDGAGRFSVPIGNASVLVFKLVTKDGVESQWVRRLGR
jgi:hypothetical protein